MIEALSALAPIAQTAAETAPAFPWATLLTGIVPGVIGAAIGYLFGTMRDWSKTKAERRARHHDEILDASAVLLEKVTAITRAHFLFDSADWKREPGNFIFPDPGLPERLDQEHLEATESAPTWRREARSALLKLNVLAPSLAPNAEDVWGTTSMRSTSPKGWAIFFDDIDRASNEFTRAVQEYLKVAPPRQWRPWIRTPVQWTKTALQKVRGLFLE